VEPKKKYIIQFHLFQPRRGTGMISSSMKFSLQDSLVNTALRRDSERRSYILSANMDGKNAPDVLLE
jgi:hypothetical protein